ncbi:MAG: hypothetical protein IJZ53_12445 [Tyzzerella sp.]|nr:hypothetical protein [Tyzzerella sp.]
MRTEDLLEAIGEVDDELLECSEKAIHKRNHSWEKWVLLAACACIVIGLGAIKALSHLGSTLELKTENASVDQVLEESEDFIEKNGSDKQTMNDSTQSESTVENAELKEAYDGTIFPITTSKVNGQLLVSRAIVYDFTDSTIDEVRFKVEDSYIITNSTEETIELQVLYPFEIAEGELQPTLTGVNQTKLETATCVEKIGEAEENVLEAYVTIPAGGSTTITAVQYKDSNAYDESKEMFEYKLVTSLNENLSMQNTTVTIIDSEFVQVEIQDFGFDLTEGNRTGKLEIGKDYYFKINVLHSD